MEATKLDVAAFPSSASLMILRHDDGSNRKSFPQAYSSVRLLDDTNLF